MKLGILHLSDIHFKAHDNSLLSKAEKLFDSIKNRLNGVDGCLLIISGDIAFSGKMEEYVVAEKFLDDLISKLESYLKLDVNISFCPGNHDCFFNDENEKLRKLALEAFSNDGFDELDTKVLETCLEPQNNFFEFAKKYTNIDYKEGMELLAQFPEFDCLGKKIQLNVYNTSWFSRKHEEPGSMLFPVEYFKDRWNYKNCDLAISVLHHPFNWLDPENSKEYRKHMDKTSDMILSGHEHSASHESYTNLTGSHTYRIEAQALQDSDKRNRSGFNLIHVDFDTTKTKVEVFDWDEGKYTLKEDTDWVLLKRGRTQRSNRFTLNKTFKDYLSNPGASFTHPNKDRLVLNDILCTQH